MLKSEIKILGTIYTAKSNYSSIVTAELCQATFESFLEFKVYELKY